VLGAGGLDREKLAFDVEKHDALSADLETDPLPLRDVVERSHFRKRCHVCASLGLDHAVPPDRHRNLRMSHRLSA